MCFAQYSGKAAATFASSGKPGSYRSGESSALASGGYTTDQIRQPAAGLRKLAARPDPITKHSAGNQKKISGFQQPASGYAWMCLRECPTSPVVVGMQ